MRRASNWICSSNSERMTSAPAPTCSAILILSSIPEIELAPTTIGLRSGIPM